MRLSGVFAPVTTPFDAVTGELDLVALRSNVRRLDGAGVGGVVLFGTTGEGPLIDDAERIAAIETVRDAFPDGLIVSGIAAESTRRAVRLVEAAAHAGADGVLVAPPSYFRPQLTPEALREHYLSVADSAPVPLLLYQVPTAYAGAPLAAGLAAELANHENIVGIKDSAGDLKGLGELVDTCPRDFTVLVGSGAILYGALELGARGGVLAVATLVPALCRELYDAQVAERDREAGALQETIGRVHREVVAAFGVAGVKAAADLLGYIGGAPRPPLRPIRPRDRDRIRAVLEELRLIDPVGAA